MNGRFSFLHPVPVQIARPQTPIRPTLMYSFEGSIYKPYNIYLLSFRLLSPLFYQLLDLCPLPMAVLR